MSSKKAINLLRRIAAFKFNNPVDFGSLIHARDIAFAAGYDPKDMTTTTKTDANIDAGITISDNTIIDSAWSAASSNGAVTLPAATVGNYAVYRQTANADTQRDLVFTCASGDFFAGDQVLSTGTGLASCTDVSAATDNTLTLQTDGSNLPWGMIGSSAVFYCRTKGYWHVKLWSVPAGSGAVGNLAFSAV